LGPLRTNPTAQERMRIGKIYHVPSAAKEGTKKNVHCARKESSEATTTKYGKEWNRERGELRVSEDLQGQRLGSRRELAHFPGGEGSIAIRLIKEAALGPAQRGSIQDTFMPPSEKPL